MGFFRHLRRWKESSAQAVVEYALVLALVALGVVAAQGIFACQVSCAFENVGFEFERIIAHKHIPPGQLKKCSKNCTKPIYFAALRSLSCDSGLDKKLE